jgi:two-component system sensor histidine kinase DevS
VKRPLPRLLGVFPDAIVIVDAQGRIIQANAEARSMFGFGEGQLNGTSLQALFPGQQVPTSDRGSRRRGGAGRHGELVGMCSSSQRFRAAVTVMPLEAGNAASAVVCIRDITEARETQFMLERGLELLRAVITSG